MSKKKWTAEEVLPEFHLVDIGDNRALGICLLKGDNPNKFYDALPQHRNREFGILYMRREPGGEKGFYQDWININIEDLELFKQKINPKKLVTFFELLAKGKLEPPHTRLLQYEKRKDAILCVKCCDTVLLRDARMLPKMNLDTYAVSLPAFMVTALHEDTALLIDLRKSLSLVDWNPQPESLEKLRKKAQGELGKVATYKKEDEKQVQAGLVVFEVLTGIHPEVDLKNRVIKMTEPMTIALKQLLPAANFPQRQVQKQLQ